MLFFHFYKSIVLQKLNIGLIIPAILIILLLIGTIVLALLYVRKMRIEQEDHQFDLKFNKVSYTYHYDKKIFYSFDTYNKKERDFFNEEKFFSLFAPSDEKPIRQWLNELINENASFPYLQVSALKKEGTKRTLTMFNFISLNKDKQIIHFDSTQILDNVIEKDDKAISDYILETNKQCLDLLDFGSDYSYKALIYFKPFIDKSVKTEEDKNLFTAMNTLLQNLLMKYLTPKRKIYFRDSGSFVIVDARSTSRKDLLSYSRCIQADLNKYYHMSQDKLNIRVAVGIALQKDFKDDISLGIAQAKQIVDISSDIANGYKKIKFYSPNEIVKYTSYDKTKAGLEESIAKGTFRLYFTPVLDLDSFTCSFYTMRIRLVNNKELPFETLFRMILSNKTKMYNFIKKIVEKIQDNLNSPEVKVALPVSLQAVDEISKILISLDAKNIKWIFLINDDDFINQYSYIEASNMARKLDVIKKEDFQLGIAMTKNRFEVPYKFLKYTDYIFIIKSQMKIEKSTFAKIRNSRNVSLSNIANRNIPLVYCSLSSLEQTPMCIINGGKFIQSDQLAGPSSRFERFDRDLVKSIEDKLKPMLSV